MDHFGIYLTLATLMAGLEISSSWTLVWSDEFNGTQVDTSKWSFQNGDGCPDVCGWGNAELQWYQEESASVKDGHLVIEASEQRTGEKNYTSAKLITKGKGDWKFGKIEINARLPETQGIWPAIWMLPSDDVYGTWPRSGEIDIMELIGHEPSTDYMTAHFGAEKYNKSQLGGKYILPDGKKFSENFHVFSIEWSNDRIEWFVDGDSKFTVTKDQVTAGPFMYPFNEKFYLILNVAVGGQWPGNPDNSTEFPQRLEVDYVRVYQNDV